MPSETRMQTASCVSDGIARYGRYSGLTKTSTALPRLAVLVFVNPLYWNLPYPLPDTEASNKAFRSDGSDYLV
ncbi:TPA: hypothetical protein WIU44_001261 [Neisseria meningitidis]|uniref:hypothetical protein n=1 Tax=Neisseria meningitidis TaxID=487 RepID=UPI0016254A07|nr:hypothetical protein [Neisseria meningitidis]